MTMGASAEVAIGGSVYQLHYNNGAGGSNVTSQTFGNHVSPYLYYVHTYGQLTVENEVLTRNNTKVKTRGYVYDSSLLPTTSWGLAVTINSSATGSYADTKPYSYASVGTAARVIVNMYDYSTSSSSATGRVLAK